MLTDLKISLVEVFHWSLYDIDQADYASTLKFMHRFTEMHGKAVAKAPITKYCDEVSWL